MKRIFLTAMFAALAFVSCDKDNFEPATQEEDYGFLSFANAGIVVSEETDTRAEGNGNYYIWVIDSEGNEIDLDKNSDVTYTTFGVVQDSGGISLPAGENYILRVQKDTSIPEASYGQPIYGAEETFDITAGQSTDLETITCNLYKQVAVMVNYNDLFKESVAGPGKTTVTIDNTNKLEFNITKNSDGSYSYDISKTGYLKFEDNPTTEVVETTTMKVSFVGKMMVDGVEKTQKMSTIIKDVAPCQTRIISFNIDEEENGNSNFSITIDGLETDDTLGEELNTSEESLAADPNAPKEDGHIRLINTAGLNDATTPTKKAWNSSFTTDVEDDNEEDAEKQEYPRPEMIVIDNNLTTESVTNNDDTTEVLPQLKFTAYVPNGIADFRVKINSEVIGPMLLEMDGITDTELDLINEPDQVSQIATIIPFPYHDPEKKWGQEAITVLGVDELGFDLSGAVPILQDLFTVEGQENKEFHDHTFQMIVKDQSNKRKNINLKLRVMNPNYVAPSK